MRHATGNVNALSRHELVQNDRGLGLVVDVQPESDLAPLGALVAQELNLTGAMNIEFLVSEGIPYLMDVNPRVSGGVRFSIDAGFDVIAEHISMYLNASAYSNVNTINGKITALQMSDEQENTPIPFMENEINFQE